MPINLERWEWRLDETEAPIVEEIMEDRIVDYLFFVDSHGFDPKTFFENGSLDGLDFRNTDISQISFKGTRLDGGIFTSEQLVDLQERDDLQYFDTGRLVIADDTVTQFNEEGLPTWPENNESGFFDNKSEHVLDPSCLDTLKQGKDVWNAWRGDGNPVRLVGADLSGANLSGYNLSKANLCYSKLDKANLKGTRLKGANLMGASIKDCSLRGLNFENANLSFTDCFGSDFQGAKLIQASLEGADLSRSIGLVAKQVKQTKRSESTRLPEGLTVLRGYREPNEQEVETKPRRRGWWSRTND